MEVTWTFCPGRQEGRPARRRQHGRGQRAGERIWVGEHRQKLLRRPALRGAPVVEAPGIHCDCDAYAGFGHRGKRRHLYRD